MNEFFRFCISPKRWLHNIKRIFGLLMLGKNVLMRIKVLSGIFVLKMQIIQLWFYLITLKYFLYIWENYMIVEFCIKWITCVSKNRCKLIVNHILIKLESILSKTFISKSINLRYLGSVHTFLVGPFIVQNDVPCSLPKL